jgi:hypothetical protein
MKRGKDRERILSLFSICLQLKQKEIELTACEEQRRKSDSYCRQCDSVLSQRFIDSLKSSIKMSGVVCETDLLTELSTKFIKLNREKDTIEATLEVSKNNLAN